jgi:hypothetical protein
VRKRKAQEAKRRDPTSSKRNGSPGSTQGECNGWWGGGMCGSWGKGSHLGSWGARSARRGKRRAVGFRQWRRIDVAGWPRTQETGSPHLQETFMHRVSVIVHCVAVIQCNHNRNRVSLYYLFQENKSFGTNHHLHSSSDVREVVSSTTTIWLSMFSTRSKKLKLGQN